MVPWRRSDQGPRRRGLSRQAFRKEKYKGVGGKRGFQCDGGANNWALEHSPVGEKMTRG